MLAISVLEALRDAVHRARQLNVQSVAFCLDAPMTPERILAALEDS